MRFALSFLVVALLTAVTMAVPPTLRDVIISFPKEAPDHLLEAAKEMVREAKGVITHEYSIIKGFAAKVPEKAFDGIKTLSTEYPPVIESDGIVTTQDDTQEGKVGV